MNKNIIISIVVVVLLGLGAIWLINNDDSNMGEDENSEMATTTDETSEVSELEDGDYTVVTKDSEVTWTGTKELVADYEDVGTIDIEEGSFVVVDGVIESGAFTIDMNSIAGAETSNSKMTLLDLSKHLKSDDFFDVATYPTASFEITDVNRLSGNNFEIMGDLTIKDKTESVTFPATLSEESDGRVTFMADFEIDRTKWDLIYGSGSFFDDLGNNVISDMIGLQLELVARSN